MLKLSTPAGVVTWENGQVSGDARALVEIHAPRPGDFGLMPDQVGYRSALQRADSFQHLARSIWPSATVLVDTEPKEPFDAVVL